MKVTVSYSQQIQEWKLENNPLKFIGSNEGNYGHEFGISPQDPNEPDHCYFNIWVFKKIENKDNGTVFSARTFNCYKVKNEGKNPTVEFYFDLVDKATFEFAKMFNERKAGSYISNDKIPIPQLEDLRPEIQQTIDFWERNIKESSLN